MARSRFVIVGAGISGLAAAWELSTTFPRAAITVVDASDRPGGKLRREPIAGVPLDVGAESMLARRPEAIDLVSELGAADEVVHPETTTAGIWSRGELHPMPSGTLMGIPSRASSALGILTAAEVERAEQETEWGTRELREHGDVTVGDYVAGRLGDAVVDRLVEPLLGGVYAGQARSLSLRACLPAVYEASSAGVSLTSVARAAAEASTASQGSQGSDGTVFAGLDGGVGRLAELLTEQLRSRGVVFRSSTIARELHRHAHGWSVIVGSRPQPERLAAEAVVLATPAAPTARLLAAHAAGASRALARVEYASMAIVTLAVGIEGAERLPGSGFLVPPVEGRTIKASTFTSAKWGWAATAGEGLAFLRASVGRAGETSDLHRPDEELVAIAVAEVSEAIGHQVPRIVDSHVQRWGGALPQYTVGHIDRIAEVRAGVSALPGLEVAGAAYEGVGIPACIATGRAAAQAVATHLRAQAQDGENDRMTGKPSPSRIREINASIRYAMWSVFAVSAALGEDREVMAKEVESLFGTLEDEGVVTRGVYDVGGLRADADFMVWWHAERIEDVQRAYRALLRTQFGQLLSPTWSAAALHRPAEFNKSHIPAFLADEQPKDFVCVYPFVRSYEWYLLPDAERRDLLREHGQMARDFPDVRANTIASFALGDYEWVLAFEADELHRIVDLMRELRASRARLHVREELPFHTGRRVEVAELIASLR